MSGFTAGNTIERAKEDKFLGLHFDERLTLEKHKVLKGKKKKKMQHGRSQEVHGVLARIHY